MWHASPSAHYYIFPNLLKTLLVLMNSMGQGCWCDRAMVRAAERRRAPPYCTPTRVLVPLPHRTTFTRKYPPDIYLSVETRYF